MILPAIQITFFTATVGGDVRDVTLDYTNLDNSKFLVCIVQSLCNDMARVGLVEPRPCLISAASVSPV